jgi:hypothetical protein
MRRSGQSLQQRRIVVAHISNPAFRRTGRARSPLSTTSVNDASAADCSHATQSSCSIASVYRKANFKHCGILRLRRKCARNRQPVPQENAENQMLLQDSMELTGPEVVVSDRKNGRFEAQEAVKALCRQDRINQSAALRSCTDGICHRVSRFIFSVALTLLSSRAKCWVYNVFNLEHSCESGSAYLGLLVGFRERSVFR